MESQRREHDFYGSSVHQAMIGTGAVLVSDTNDDAVRQQERAVKEYEAEIVEAKRDGVDESDWPARPKVSLAEDLRSLIIVERVSCPFLNPKCANTHLQTELIKN
jgi:hypothetical protein